MCHIWYHWFYGTKFSRNKTVVFLFFHNKLTHLKKTDFIYIIDLTLDPKFFGRKKAIFYLLYLLESK